MGFDDNFGHKDHHAYNRYNRHYPHGYSQRNEILSHGERDHGHAYRGRNHHPGPDIGYLLMKIKSNPKLRVLLFAGITVTLLLLFILAIAMLPLIIKFIDFIQKAGIQGVIDWVTSFLDTLWKGSGK